MKINIAWISTMRSNVIFLKLSNRVVYNFDLVEKYPFSYDCFDDKNIIELTVTNNFEDILWN